MSAVLYINLESDEQDIAVSPEIPVRYVGGGHICVPARFCCFIMFILSQRGPIISLTNAGNPIVIQKKVKVKLYQLWQRDLLSFLVCN